MPQFPHLCNGYAVLGRRSQRSSRLRSPQRPPGGVCTTLVPRPVRDAPRRFGAGGAGRGTRGAGHQRARRSRGGGGVRAGARARGGGSGARFGPCSRGRARPRERARRRVHFYPSEAKNSRGARSRARNSRPQIRQDDSALPGSGRGMGGRRAEWVPASPARPTASLGQRLQARLQRPPARCRPSPCPVPHPPPRSVPIPHRSSPPPAPGLPSFHSQPCPPALSKMSPKRPTCVPVPLPAPPRASGSLDSAPQR
ncbi:PREDICTED: vegetative cell wall protein gp1-like [Chinchilla lanigera]|uniref:vegetative cell wall protein gp1-like n=1 Tax=Chinchilla lanigera TaxID=34839 RepID=UPI000697AC99|nr:PREDICTED: vegetative cell wall protein gp1-like [Chinchilla lanigera]